MVDRPINLHEVLNGMHREVYLDVLREGWTEHAHHGHHHTHAHGDVTHDHLLRQVCGRLECTTAPTHNIHPDG